jgi:predicted ATPase
MTAGPVRQPVPFVTRVRLRNFRSIADCDVALGPLTVLVGFNASGKSNFLDALRFVADALRTSLGQAVSERGGLDKLLFRGSTAVADSFEIELSVMLPPRDGGEPAAARYAFEVAPDPRGDLPVLVRSESVRFEQVDRPVARIANRPDLGLLLPLTALLDDYAPAGDLDAALRAMTFFDLDSTVLAELAEPTSSRPVLGRRGANLGPVLGAIAQEDPLGKERLDAYLSAVVPHAVGVDERREGRFSTVEAHFHAGEGGPVKTFQRENLSEGTLRTAGVLAALFQPAVVAGRVPLVGIEEPETAIHPSAVGALYEAFDDAARHTQVIVTSQSSDLLDSEYARLDHLRAVASVGGATVIGEVDAAGHAIVEKSLMSISELHRSGQMRPESVSRPAGGGEGR